MSPVPQTLSLGSSTNTLGPRGTRRVLTYTKISRVFPETLDFIVCLVADPRSVSDSSCKHLYPFVVTFPGLLT